MCVFFFIKRRKMDQIELEYRVLELEDQIRMEDMRFIHFLKMDKDSAAWIELGRSFHQMGTVNEKVCESDFFASLGGHNNASFTCRTQASRWHIGLK